MRGGLGGGVLLADGQGPEAGLGIGLVGLEALGGGAVFAIVQTAFAALAHGLGALVAPREVCGEHWDAHSAMLWDGESGLRN